jgi:hypothetical protein
MEAIGIVMLVLGMVAFIATLTSSIGMLLLYFRRNAEEGDNPLARKIVSVAVYTCAISFMAIVTLAVLFRILFSEE